MPSLAPSPLLEEEHAAAASEDVGAPSETDPRALTDFRPRLDPYGTWVNHPTYGTVWVPRTEVVGSSFAPYVSSGHWALDSWGEWVWVSDYPFGSVVFHYGRWVWISGSGWAWIPGYRYAPAWVHWRVPVGSYAYVGWAPMGPDYIWYNGVAVSFGYGLHTPWVFCPSVYVFHRHVHHYVVRDRGLVTRIAENTRRYTPANPRAAGPSRRFTARSPSLASARVPDHAVPRERVRASASARVVGSAVSRPTRLPATVDRADASRFRAEPRVVRPDRDMRVPSRTVAPERRAVPAAPLLQGSERVRRAEPARRAAPPHPERSVRPEPVVRPEVRDRAAPTRRNEARPPDFTRRVEPVRSAPVPRAAPTPRGGGAGVRRALPRGR